MNPGIILLIAIGVAVYYVISVYNSLSATRTRIQASIQEIGNQLKRQFELIPNLEESAKSFLKHEKEIFKLLTDARKSASAALKSQDASEISTASEKISQLLPKLQVLVESNPQIKGADVVTKLMDELRDTSDKVMYSRRTLIDLTADYNTSLVTFPSNVVANMFGFKPERGLATPTTGSHLEVAAQETKSPTVKLG